MHRHQPSAATVLPAVSAVSRAAPTLKGIKLAALAVFAALVSCSARTRTPPKTAALRAPTTAAPAADSASSLLDELVDVGRVTLHLVCAGRGAPLVVFDSGLGMDGSVWQRIQPQIADGTRACAYDRAGRGHSGPAPYPHDQRQMADELYTLLQKAGQLGPYLLVGHSMGGANVRWFLDAHPNEVAGMVLLDPATEDWPSRVLSRVPADAQPEFWRNLRAWEGLDPDSYIAGYEGLRNSTASLGNRPLLILTAGRPESELPLRLEMHAGLERLSSNVLHLVADESAHNIQLDAPATVLDSIRAVLQAARTHSSLSESAIPNGARRAPVPGPSDAH